MLMNELWWQARTLTEVTCQTRLCQTSVWGREEVLKHIISLAFVIVTILYETAASDCTGVTEDHAQNIKKLVHYDILAVDNSNNGGDTIEKVDDDGKVQTIACNCGEKAVLTILVLIAISIFLVYVACGICTHFCAVFLKRKQANLLKNERTEKQARHNLDSRVRQVKQVIQA